MSFQPSRIAVISVAAATAPIVAGTAVTAIGTSYRYVTIEVDGVTRDVSGFFATASDALHSVSVTAGDHSLVVPASNQAVVGGDAVVVCTATGYDVTIGDNQTIAWSIASSISGAFSTLSASVVSMAAGHSCTRAKMPIVEVGQTVHVVVDGITMDVVVSSNEDTIAILEKADTSAGPIGRTTLEHNGGETTLHVVCIVYGTVSSVIGIPHEIEGREDAEAEEGIGKTMREGMAGSEVTEAYQETIDGDVTVSAAPSTTRTEPTKRIVSKGTKTKEVEDVSSSSSTSSDSSDTSSSGSSTSTPAAVSGDDAVIWAAIAQCESDGNPSTNTGNGYYGMYQFSLSTWCSAGDSGLPSDASVERQAMRARILQQHSGWGQWGCTHKLGLV